MFRTAPNGALIPIVTCTYVKNADTTSNVSSYTTKNPTKCISLTRYSIAEIQIYSRTDRTAQKSQSFIRISGNS